MNILVDADALVALAKEDDANHKKAVEIARRIKEANLFLSPLTIPEAVSVLSHRVSQPAAVAFLREALQRRFSAFSLTEELEAGTDKIFVAQKARGTSWADCLNIALARQYSVDAIFSFDKVYARNGLKVLS